MENKKKSISLSNLLFLVNGIVLSIGFAVLLFININALKNTAEEQTESNLRSFAKSVVPLVVANENNLDAFVKSIASNNSDFRISVIDSNGVVIADSEARDLSVLENHLERSEVQSALNGKEGRAIRESTVTKNEVMYYAIPFYMSDALYVLRLDMGVNTSIYFSTNVREKMIFAAVFIFALIILISFLISWVIIKNIRKLEKSANEYKKGNFDYKNTVNSPRELYELGGAMQNMAQEIKRVDLVRKDFVANVSHELKTPVTSIKGFSETLLDGALDDKETATHFVQIINNQCARLISIIEDLLTLSRLEQDSKKIESEKCDVVLLVKKICAEYELRAKEKGISINFYCEFPHLYSMLNSGLFTEAVANLIDNAIKYCPEKSLIDCIISILEPTDNTDARKIKIIVQDNGNGIPAEYRERIFERFYRLDKGRSRAMGGTGLGLSIARHIVTGCGGKLYATERIDGRTGARFVIELPLVSY